MHEILHSAAEFVCLHRNAFFIYLAAVNLIAFILYALDKLRAKKGAWRIPESRLIGIAVIGGSLGALLGMQLLRHKTQHAKFVVTVPLALVFHTIIITAVVILTRY